MRANPEEDVVMYRVNEIFLSVQGEGVRAGTANVFVRFQGCNLACRREAMGFDCDTEFSSGVLMSAQQILQRIEDIAGECHWIILTGGEPALQLDRPLVDLLKGAGYSLAIETNGTVPLPEGLDWICVSPKTAEHTLRVYKAHEVKYVRHAGQGIPDPIIEAEHYLISPAWDADGVSPATLRHCLQLVKDHPDWRLSIQTHKLLGVR